MLFRRHISQRAQSKPHCFSTIVRHTTETLEQVPGAVPLLGIHALPGVHAVEYLFAPLGGEAVEFLKAVAQTFLLLRRQLAECRIVLEGAFLLLRRKVTVLAQPVAISRADAGTAINARILPPLAPALAGAGTGTEKPSPIYIAGGLLLLVLLLVLLLALLVAAVIPLLLALLPTLPAVGRLKARTLRHRQGSTQGGDQQTRDVAANGQLAFLSA